MVENITVGSLFDGIGGWQLAAKRAGAVPVWSSEIDPFPMAVSKAHFPETKQLGDITKIKGDEIEPVDIVCAGSPCQDLSVAGKRAGLEGNRSNLFYQSLRIVREMQEKTNGQYPKFFIWENVTGAFSSNERRDFQAVLEEIGQTEIPMPKSGRWAKAGMVRSKKCGIAWRVLDAQYWGVPQHRERIFLVAGFGKWGESTEVLFKPESMPGNPCESEEGGKETATGTRSHNNAASKWSMTLGGASMNTIEELAGALRARDYKDPQCVFDNIVLNDQGGGRHER